MKVESLFHILFELKFPPKEVRNKMEWLSDKYFEAAFTEIKYNVLHQFVHEYFADDYPEYNIPKYFKLSAKLESDYSYSELGKSIDTVKEDSYSYGYEIGFNVAKGNWFHVKHILPENKSIVLAIDEHGEMAVCKFEKTKFEYFFMLHNTSHQVTKVTHWRNLPEVPNE